MKRHLVVIEDDRGIRLGLVDNLEDEGYRVTARGDLGTGIPAACEAGVDLIILDRMLPDGDGLELLRALRRRGAQVPVLVLTARAQADDRLKGLLDGADDYVTKPFSMAEVLARVAAILRRACPAGTEPLRLGELELDPAARSLRRGGEPLALTPREFDLLKVLAARPGQVFSRQALLDAVWGLNYEGGERVVDRFIATLRRKVEREPSRPRHIITLPGAGYRLDP